MNTILVASTLVHSWRAYWLLMTEHLHPVLIKQTDLSTTGMRSITQHLDLQNTSLIVLIEGGSHPQVSDMNPWLKEQVYAAINPRKIPHILIF